MTARYVDSRGNPVPSGLESWVPGGSFVEAEGVEVERHAPTTFYLGDIPITLVPDPTCSPDEVWAEHPDGRRELMLVRRNGVWGPA